MQLRVETAGLREGVAVLEEVLARLERVHVARDLAPVGAALRGGQTPAATSRACAAWGERLSELRWQVRAAGAALDVAAAGYDAVEDVARRALARGSGT